MNCNQNFAKKLIDHVNLCICLFDSSGKLVDCNQPAASRFSIEPQHMHSDFSGLPVSYKKISCLKKGLRSVKPIFEKKTLENNTVFYLAVTPLQDEDSGSTYFMETCFIPPSETVTADPVFSQPLEDLVLSDATMQEINQTISRIAYFDSTILLTGESGTGKTMLAKHIHKHSGRAQAPFITINCGVIPENLIESELFGYASGAFTNASNKGKSGLVELADKGTLFLDEVGLLPYNVQTKLLQFAQEKTFTPVGGLKSKTVDVRLISATNLDLKEQVEKKQFREDLYYRLRVIEFSLPPLRKRQDAIEPMIHHFLDYYNHKFGIRKTISPQAQAILKAYSWPGNIRELQYLLERVIVTSNGDMITAEDIPPLQDSPSETPAAASPKKNHYACNFDAAVAQFEKELLAEAFAKHKSSYKVADALGISQTKASRLLRKYDIR